MIKTLIMVTLLSIIVVLLVGGILIWAIQKYLPIDPVIKNIVCFIVVLIGVVYVLQIFGVLGGLRIR